MKIFNVFILITFSTICYSQQWIESMQKTDINYYDALKEFNQWHDSISSFEKSLPSEKQAEFKHLKKSFKKWAMHFRGRMDTEGNYLSDDLLWKQHENYLKLNNQANLGTWHPIGPTYVFPKTKNYGNGMLSCVAVNPLDTAIIYIGAYQGGLWKTINGGINWIPLTDTLARFGVRTIAIDPINPDILYIIILNKLYKSTNGGNSWLALNVNPMYFDQYGNKKILINPINSQIIYLLSYGNLIKSVDGGLSWTLLLTGVGDIALNPLNPNTIYLLIAGTTSKFYSSYDGGTSFDSLQINGTYGPQEIGVTAADTNYIYLLATGNSPNGMVYLSTDGGNSFTGQPTSNVFLTFNDLRRFIVSQTDKNTLLFGGINIARTTDGGLTWSHAIRWEYDQPGLPFVHVDQRQMIAIGPTIWFANDGGIYKTDDHGLSYYDLTGNLQVTELESIACSPNDTIAIIGGGWHLGVLQRSDSGWACVGYGDGFNVALNPLNSDELFWKSQYGYTRTSDGGLTYNSLSGITENTYAFDTKYPLVFNYENPNSTYLLIKNVFKSVNGVNFTQISNFPTFLQGGGFLFVCSTDSNYIYTKNMRSTDAGQTWTPLTEIPGAPGLIAKIAVDKNQPFRIWKVSSTGMYFSSDTGTTWQQIPTPDIEWDIIKDFQYVDNGYDGLYLVLQNKIYYIDNRLSNWQPFYNGLPYINFTGVSILENINRIRLSTLGRGFWESNFYDSTQPLSVDFISQEDTVCVGLPVKYYDNSLNNGPGFNPVYNWSFPGGTPSTSNAAQPIVTYSSPGIYNVTLNVTNSNGSGTVTKTAFIVVEYPLLKTAPFIEDFEAGNFIPPGWKVINDDNWSKWFVTGIGAYGTGLHSIVVLNLSAPQFPQNEIILSPDIDISALQVPLLSYDWAYAMDTINADTLKIFYTTDCGLTKNYFYTKGGADLATASPDNNNFVPTATQWASGTILLSGFPNTIQLGFESANYNGNTLYIDNINIFDGIPTNTDILNHPQEFSIHPNPTTGELNITFQLDKSSNVKIELYNSLGQLVKTITDKKLMAGENKLNFSTGNIPAGIYHLKFAVDGNEIARKVVKM